MLLHFKFAILLATQEIMFVNSSKFNPMKWLRSPKSKIKQSKSKIKVMDITDFITGPQKLSQVLGIPDDQIRQSSTTEEPLTPEGEALLGMMQKFYLNARDQEKASNRGSQNRNLCCDDNIGTIHCVWLGDGEDCDRILSTRNRTEDTTPPIGTQRRVGTSTSWDSTRGNQDVDFTGLNQRQRTSGNSQLYGSNTSYDEPEPKSDEKPYNYSYGFAPNHASPNVHARQVLSKPTTEPWRKHSQKSPVRTTSNAPSRIQPQESFNESPLNLADLFKSNLQPQPPQYEQSAKPAAESQTNLSELFGSNSQRTPDKINVAPPVFHQPKDQPIADPLNESQPQKPDPPRSKIGLVPGTPTPEYRDGRQIRYKTGKDHKPVDRDEFYRDMLSQHNYFRRKHEISLLEEDQNLHVTAQSYADELAKKNELDVQHSHWPNLGENLYSNTSRANRMGLAAVNRWWGELQFCTTTETAQTLDEKMPQPNTIGHLLQLLWIGSTRVGFGIARSETGLYFVVAHYTPPGNGIRVTADGVRIGPLVNMLPLPFKQQHIDEAKELADTMKHQSTRGVLKICYVDEDLNSEEAAQEYSTIYD